MVGTVTKLVSALMALPLIVSLIYKESCATAFAISIGVAFITGFGLCLISKPSTKVIYAREGFIVVSLAWIVLSVIGALPFYISREIPSFVDALFETVSGFTTTGASILTDVEAMSKGLLFWRSLTNWMGGMGVLVFVLAVVPSVSDRTIHILKAEAPGPIVGKIVPKMRKTARILYIIYIVFTLILFVLLLLGGMPIFESIIHSFSTASTGGFGAKADSITSYSPYIQWVIAIFMLIFGVNFNLYYLMLIKKFRTALKSEELWMYIGIIIASTIAITANILPSVSGLSEAVRLSVFQVSSLITSTGYSTADFNLWPTFSKTLLFLMMFIGGCAGSTAGGFKISRVVLLLKKAKIELKKMLHPRSVSNVRFEGKRISNDTMSSVSSYLVIYTLLFCVFVFLLGFENFDLESNISAVASCFNNMGPALGVAGPASSYAMYSPFSKLVLSLAMLLGRLEILPIILTFSPSTWTKR